MIGLFSAHLNDSYQAGIWRGIESRAAQLGIGVVTFVGSHVGSSIPTERSANFAYHIADPGMIDGLIIVSAAIGYTERYPNFSQEFASLKGIPTVSVGVGLPGALRVGLDSAEAIAETVRHLTEAHGRRAIALINGPRDHEEVHDRREAFLAAIRQQGLSFDGRLDQEGHFSKESGIEAARRLLQSGAAFDALFCMNDLMAIGAIDALREAGLRVPQDVSVIGFDGIEEGRTLVHPLTSVVQPLFEIGATSVDLVADLMAGGVSEDQLLRCYLSVSESCGCPPGRAFRPAACTIPALASAADRAVIEELIARGRQGDEEGFMAVLNEAAAASVLAGDPPTRWNDLLSFVRREIAEPTLKAGAHAVAAASDPGPGRAGGGAPNELFESARALLVQIDARMRDGRRAASHERYRELQSVSSSLAASFEIEAILEQLRTALDRLGIGPGFVALFDDGPPSLEWASLVLAPERAKATRKPFRTSQLLPPEIAPAWRGRPWVFEPLIYQDERLGYLLLPGGIEEPAIYDRLRDQVSRALKGALLLRQVKVHERRLEDEVRKRTREITLTNAELKREIVRRVRLEEEIVAISNRTMERIGQDLHDDLCQHLAGIAMHTLTVRDALEREGHPKVEAVKRIGDLLSGSILRVREIARGLIPAGLEHRGLTAAIRSLVESARTNYPVAIDFRAAPEFSLPDMDRAFQIYRIIQEALSNALKHSGARRIAVTLGCEGTLGRSSGAGPAMLFAEVVDTGSGLPSSMPSDGMGLRIMRYRAAQAGAQLRVEHSSEGTRVVCRIPQQARSSL